MNIEFHYYTLKGIALRAGFDEEEAEILSYSSQYTDDNNVLYSFQLPNGDTFKNYISQTKNILKPRKTLIHIYPIFHFIPGDIDSKINMRKDGEKSGLLTTPDSSISKAILSFAFATHNLYRIGIALHGFADTWSHQNFIGLNDPLNALSGFQALLTPNTGHADARFKPDYISYSWHDERLKNTELQNISNNCRFIQAAERIFYELSLYKSKPLPWIKEEWKRLKSDLLKSWGIEDPKQKHKNQRIHHYKEYLGVSTTYNKNEWFEQSIVRKKLLEPFLLKSLDSHWFNFQQAIIDHQIATKKFLRENIPDFNISLAAVGDY